MDLQQFVTITGAGVAGLSSGSVPPPPSSVARSADFPGGDTEFLVKTADVNTDLGAGPYVITLFIRPTFLAEIGTVRGILGKGTALGVAATDLFYLYYSRISNKLVFRVSDGTTITTVQSAGPLINDAWHFVAITYNATTDVLSMTIDEGTPVTATSVLDAQSAELDFRIGSVQGSFSAWKGQISLVGIFDELLSAGQITEIYNTGLGKLYSGLAAGTQSAAMGYWQLDETTGTRDDKSAQDTNLAENAAIGSSSETPS